MIIENFLKNLGLTDNETKLYLYLLTHGESIASIISKRMGMKRVTVYSTLEALEKKDMVVTFIKNNVAQFDAIEPEDIMDLVQQRIKEMERLRKRAHSLKDEFKKLRDKGKMPTLEIRGKVKYYQGLDAVTDLIDETLEEPVKEQLCFGLNTYHTELAGDDWGNYTERRVKKGISVKSIQPDIREAVEYKSRDAKELRLTHLVPHEKFPGKCEINIMGNMIAMFSTSGREPVGMKMKNKEMAEALRSLFLLAWERAEGYEKGVRRKHHLSTGSSLSA